MLTSRPRTLIATLGGLFGQSSSAQSVKQVLGFVGALEGGKVLAHGIDAVVGLNLRDGFSLLSCMIKLPDLRVSGGEPLANRPMPGRPAGCLAKRCNCRLVLPEHVVGEAHDARRQRLIKRVESNKRLSYLDGA